MSLDNFFMKKAYLLAKKSFSLNEVPVGAVITYKNFIIGKGLNVNIKKNDPTAHAEIIAIKNASRKIKNYRFFKNTKIYVTLEPCLMCLGAIINSRLSKIIFCLFNKKFGFSSKKGIDFKNKIKLDNKEITKKYKLMLKKFFIKKRIKKIYNY